MCVNIYSAHHNLVIQQINSLKVIREVIRGVVIQVLYGLVMRGANDSSV